MRYLKQMSSIVAAEPSYISHAASETLVTLLCVVYVHRKTSGGGDIYLTRFGLPLT